MSGGRIAQIDIIKGLAILAVIGLHTATQEWLDATAFLFHIGQPVPVFMTVMGITAAISIPRLCERTKHWLRVYYTRRVVRLLLPWAVVVVVTGAVQILHSIASGAATIKLDVGWETLLGVTPISGAGNYFVGLVIQWALLAPLIWFLFSKWPRITLAGSAVITTTFLLLAPAVPLFTEYGYAYSAALPRYLLLCVLGMWIAKDQSFTSTHNRWMIPFMALAIVYLIARTVAAEPLLPFLPSWETQNPVSYFYSIGLVMLGMRLLPGTAVGPLWGSLAVFGMASFHIFLTQMVFFGVQLSAWVYAGVDVVTSVPGVAALVATIISFVVCVSIGVFWWWAERRLIWDRPAWKHRVTAAA